jgi:NADPH:quinone reductase-like Zn-dependent oxidoreductase
MATPKTMFAWQSPVSGHGLETDLVFNPSAPVPPLPKSGPYTLVKVLRASLNPVDDKLSRSRLVAPVLKKPFTPGMDFAGTVVTTTAPGLAPGDLVVGMINRIPKHGALGEYVLALPADLVSKIDPSLRPRLDELACCGVAAVTANSTTAGLPTGSKIFINGSSGGVGTLTVQMAKARGLHVVATCSARNADLVASLGADVILDYNKVNVADALEANVAETGVKFARSVDNVGQNALYYQCHRWMAPEAEFVYIGGSPTAASIWGVVKMSTLPGVLGGGRRKFKTALGGATPDMFQETVDMIVDGRVEVVLDGVYELDQAREAYKSLHEGRARGKKVVKVSD